MKVTVSSCVCLSGPLGACCRPTPGLGDSVRVLMRSGSDMLSKHRCSLLPLSSHLFPCCSAVMTAERLWHWENCRLNYWWVTEYVWSVASGRTDHVGHPWMRKQSLLLWDGDVWFVCCGSVGAAADEVQCAAIILISQRLRTGTCTDFPLRGNSRIQRAQAFIFHSNKRGMD